MSSVAISIFPEFIDKIETLGLRDQFEITQSEIINKLTGSKIIFKGIKAGSGQQTANLKSIANVDTLVVDESEEIPDEATFDKIDLSVRSSRHFNKIIILFNPTTKASWIYTRFFESKGVEPGTNTVKGNTTYIHTTYLDIQNMLPQNFLDTINEMKRTNPRKYKHTMLGAFLDVAEGVIFSNWILGEFPEDSDYDLGADFGYSTDPTALVKVLIDNKTRTLYVKECVYETGLLTSPIAKVFKEYAGNRLIVADLQEGRLIEELRRMNLNIKPCTKGAGSVAEGIKIIQDYKMIVDPSSTNLIKELNNYVWAERGNKPVDMYNHCFIGETLITTRHGDVRIDEIKPGMEVLTSKGYKKVLRRFDNGMRQVETYSIQCGINTITLTSTPDHKVKTNKNNEIVWKQISKLESQDQVYLLNTSMEKSLDSTQDTIISQTDRQECISMSGNIIMEPHQRDTTFTTKTRINGTTPLKILNSLKGRNIVLNMQVKDLRKIQSFLKDSIRRASKLLKLGIQHQKESKNIEGLVQSLGRMQYIELIPVSNVERISNPDQTKFDQSKKVIQDIATLTVDKEQQGEGKRRIERVYDIMVEDCHEYFANGLLVHNCIDGLRYLVMHRTKQRKVERYGISGIKKLAR